MNNRIERVSCAEALPGVRVLHTSGYQAVVSEYGAHLLSWRDPQGHELLFVSQAAQYQIGSAIRGGIPVVFPQFGNGVLSKHGFARTSMWKIVREHVPADGPVSVTFRLVVKAGMYELWPHECVVELEVELSDVLLTTLRVHNTGQTECKFFCALHTYFNIHDIDGVRVSGLQGVEYIDFLDQLRQSVESREDVVFTEPVDRVYLDSPQVVVLYSDSDQRRYLITKEGFSDSVVWNPWIEGARAIADLHSQEYRNMVCVESGNVVTPVIVQPGEVHTSVQVLRVERYTNPSPVHF
jgi:glucose-6-phosphate 1-epimerase